MSSVAAPARAGAQSAENAASDETALQSVANAMRDAASTATGHASDVYAAAGGTAPAALRAISHATYTTACVASYGVVFLAQSLMLLDNPLARGLYDGGAAARKAARNGRVNGNSARGKAQG